MSKGIDELAGIEFRGSLEVATYEYGRQLYVLGRRLAMELEMAAGDCEAAMVGLHGNPLLFGMDAKLKARRVARRLRRAQDAAYGMAEEGRRFHAAYVQHIIDKAR